MEQEHSTNLSVIHWPLDHLAIHKILATSKLFSLVALLLFLLPTAVMATQSLRSGATFAGIDGTCKFEKPGDPNWLYQRFTCVVPYAECAAYIADWRANSPGSQLYYYISGTDMPPHKSYASNSYNSGMKSTWIRDRIVALGGIEEEAYMHFYNDTRIRNWNGSSWDTLLIRGTNSMTIQPKDSVSRVPNGYTAYLFMAMNTYTYPARMAPNFQNSRLRKAYKEYITHIFSPAGSSYWPDRTGYWDGVYFDNYNHTNLQGAGLVSGGLVVETGTNPANLLTYASQTFADWGWSQMLMFGREVRDTLQLADLWSIDHKKKSLAYNFGNYHKSVLENPDSSGCDLVHYEFAWDPVYCNNSSTHRLENLYSRDSLAASRGVTFFWSSVPRTTYGALGSTTLRQAIYSNLCFYLTARTDSTWLFIRPASGNAYGAFSNPNFDTLAWIPAMGYELGWPAQHYQLAASGAAVDQSGGSYKVWSRQYPYGIVYVRPVDGFDAKWGSQSTPITVSLGGNYRQLQTDGTLGTVVTQISLRGGEGAIMIPATSGECTNPPTVPTAATPASGATVASVTPSLCITSSSQTNCTQPIRYHFQVSTSSGFAAISQENGAVTHSAGTSCWQIPTALSPGTTYYWRSRAGNGVSWSTWSTSRSFVTPNNAPSAPIAASPANAATVTTRQPSLAINNSTDPEGTTPTYHFQVAPTSAFATITAQNTSVVQGSGGTTAWQVTILLNNQTTYYWRARAYDGVNYSAWSTVRSLYVNSSTTNSAPTAPTVNSPTNSATVNSSNPLLRVNNSTDADGNTLTYQVELYDSTLAVLLAISPMLTQGTGTTAWTVSVNLVNNARYRWRARAYDGQVWSSYMTTSEFRVVLISNSPPSVPVPLTPTGNQPIIGQPILLMTNNSLDVDGDPLFYSFRVFSDSLLTKQIEISNGRAEANPYTSYSTTSSYLHNKPYWWTVRAFDGAAYSDWASGQKFTYLDVALDIKGAPTLLSPAEGAMELSTKPTFRINWNGSNDTVACVFELDYDGDFADLYDGGIVAGFSGVAQWIPGRALENESTYYWRAKVANSSYAEAVRFSVSSPIYASPNPFSYLDGELTIHNLPEGAKLEVFTPSGDKVIEIENLAGDFKWDVRNSAGERLGSGVFLYYVTFGGQKFGDKIIVVR